MAAAGQHLRRALPLVPLAGVVVCAWVVVTGAAYRPTALVPARQGGFPLWLRGPLGELGGYLPYDEFALWMVVMCAVWVIALATVRFVRPAVVAGVVVALHLLFALGPPLLSSDVFGYLDWARMGVLHGLNPYATDSGRVVSDAVYPFVRWDDFASPYGPLFTLGTYALVPLGLPLSLWALKLAVLVASLGCCAILWTTAEQRGRDPRLALALYGLNPAVLVYAVGGAHNDVPMMAAVLGAVWLALRGRAPAGAAAGALAVAVKASAGLVVPFLVLGAPDRRRALRAAAAAGAGVVAVAFVAFGTHALDFVNVLRTQQDLDSGTSVTAQLGAVLGWHGNPLGARIVASTAFVAALAALLWRTWREPAEWLDAAGWATAALLACTSWLLAWYIVWLVPLAALARSRVLPAVAVGFSVFVVLTRVVPFL